MPPRLPVECLARAEDSILQLEIVRDNVRRGSHLARSVAMIERAFYFTIRPVGPVIMPSQPQMDQRVKLSGKQN